MSQHQRAIVIGASSGIGQELAIQLAEAGWIVAAVARREKRLGELETRFPGKIMAFVHDVTDYEAIPAKFQEITGKMGGLDLVIYASGVMPTVEEDEFNFSKDRKMIEVNDLGAVAWLNEVATRFQNTKHGSIVAIGSVAGDRGRQGQPVYNASKAFLHTYMEALRNRLSRHGVRVVTIKPGPVATEMTAGLQLKKAMSAPDAAKAILRKINRTGEHYLSPVHAVAFLIIRNIPSWIFRRLKV